MLTTNFKMENGRIFSLFYVPLLSVLTLLWISFLPVDGINCYVCNSRNRQDPSCHDPFHPANSTYREHCKMSKENHMGVFPAHFCVKIMGQNVLTKDELVVRMCTIENMDNQCGTFRFDNETLSGCIMSCIKDGCNAGHSSKYSFFTMILITGMLSYKLLRKAQNTSLVL